jgi:sporadic carbohydrate cluster 2OG-Fe(II) oxygenase/sporadic carbohydrate cluster protein (TIGR04323 family)
MLRPRIVESGGGEHKDAPRFCTGDGGRVQIMMSNKILHYDTEAMPFRDALLAVCAKFTADRYGQSLQGLETLHALVPPSDVAALYAEIYRFVDSLAFKQLYAKLGRYAADTLFQGKAAFQRVPSIRLHFVGQKSVQFHTDEWYGHGQDVVNCWVPLISVAGNNSMFVTTPEESEELAGVFARERMSVQDMNERMRARSRPLDCRVGDIFVFSSRLMHGSEVNDTAATRVSFDFRLLPDGAARGVKSTRFFASPPAYEAELLSDLDAARGRSRIGIVYVNVHDGFTRFVNQRIQQLLAARYAEDCNISVLTAETEIVTMSHYPMLFDLLAGGAGRQCEVLLLFSVALLPRTESERRRVFQMAREANLELKFVIEDVTFPRGGTPQDEERILALRDQVLQSAA